MSMGENNIESSASHNGIVQLSTLKIGWTTFTLSS